MVIWSSGVGTLSAILGIVVGLMMYSPRQRYQRDGAPTSIPYRGWKRWHTIIGLIFGLSAATWAFSGMLSMDPFPVKITRGRESGLNIPGALRGGFRLAAFDEKPPSAALTRLGTPVKELELTSFDGEPVYIASTGRKDTHIVPMEGEPAGAFDKDSVIDIIRRAAGAVNIAEIRVLDDYDSYYLDRRHERPLPVVLMRLRDAENTRYYIDPKTARVAGSYNSSRWVTRWLYHGLHSFDFPFLYKYRPLWDIVVISFMLGGSVLSITSVILAWRMLRGRVARLFAGRSRTGG